MRSQKIILTIALLIEMFLVFKWRAAYQVIGASRQIANEEFLKYTILVVIFTAVFVFLWRPKKSDTESEESGIETEESGIETEESHSEPEESHSEPEQSHSESEESDSESEESDTESEESDTE